MASSLALSIGRIPRSVAGSPTDDIPPTGRYRHLLNTTRQFEIFPSSRAISPHRVRLWRTAAFRGGVRSVRRRRTLCGFHDGIGNRVGKPRERADSVATRMRVALPTLSEKPTECRRQTREREMRSGRPRHRRGCVRMRDAELARAILAIAHLEFARDRQFPEREATVVEIERQARIDAELVAPALHVVFDSRATRIGCRRRRSAAPRMRTPERSRAFSSCFHAGQPPSASPTHRRRFAANALDAANYVSRAFSPHRR